MPFVAWSPNGDHKQLCCLKRGDAWKVHYFDNGVFRKLATYTNEDATECSPTAEFDPFENNWRISFIAGGSTADNWKDVGFYLYLKRGFDDSAPVKICPANYGYLWKHQVVFGTKDEPVIHIIEDGLETKITLKDIDYIYRLNYDIDNPDSILISAQKKDESIVTFSYIPDDDNLYLMKDGEEPIYKWCMGLNGEIYYCRKSDEGGFEDRHIVEAANIKRKRYNKHLFISKIEHKATDFPTENFKEMN